MGYEIKKLKDNHHIIMFDSIEIVKCFFCKKIKHGKKNVFIYSIDKTGSLFTKIQRLCVECIMDKQYTNIKLKDISYIHILDKILSHIEILNPCDAYYLGRINYSYKYHLFYESINTFSLCLLRLGIYKDLRFYIISILRKIWWI